jgi:predicted Zn-dependent protease
MKQNVDNIFKRQREYCKNCIQEIKDKIESWGL